MAKKTPTKDPEGGLTEAGRAKYKKEEGANLKPGVKKPLKDMTPDEMKRKGSFLRRHFANLQGPLKDDDGKPTRLALQAHAWGEPVPKTEAAAKKLADKGAKLLERYKKAKEKDAKSSQSKSSTRSKAKAKSSDSSDSSDSSGSSPYTDPALRDRLKAEIQAGDKGGHPGQWSARKSQLLASEYKKAGGGYTRGKAKKAESQADLDRWTDEHWTTADGSPALRDGETARYLPEKAWDALTPRRAESHRPQEKGRLQGRYPVRRQHQGRQEGPQGDVILT